MIEDTTYDLLMQGYNYKEISDRIQYTQEFYFARVTKKLKDEGRITDAEIETAKFNRFQKRRMEVVLLCLKRGLNYPETVKYDENLKITPQQYKDCKEKLIANGDIIEEEIKAQKKLTDELRMAERAEEYEGPHDKEIIRLTENKMSSLQIAKELGVGRSYVTTRQRAIRKKEQDKKRGVTEEQIERILNKELKRVLERGSVYRINKILRTLILYRINYEAIAKSIYILADIIPQNLENLLKLLLDEYKISKEAVENCLSILAEGKENEMREIFKILIEEHLIAKEKIEGCLKVLARGKADKIREIFKVLDKHRISKKAIENCLSVLAVGNADEIQKILGIFLDNGVRRKSISNSLYTIATGKAINIENIFEKLKNAKLDANIVLRRGLGMLANANADEVEKMILTLQNNGVRNEIIAEELSAIANSSTSEEVEAIFDDTKEPTDKEKHYINVRRYMKLKELYGRIYKREEIEKLCVQKHLSVREFISEIVTYPNGKDFTDIYYEKLMTEGTLYVGGSTDIDRDYQELHGEELIGLSKRIARKFALNTRFKDYAEIESKALEIILTRCGNLVHNLSNNSDLLRGAIFSKTMKCLRSELRKMDMNTLSLTYTYGDDDRNAIQRDIPVRDNASEHYYNTEGYRLGDRIDYEKAQFDKQETQVMKCMIRLVEERRSG